METIVNLEIARGPRNGGGKPERPSIYDFLDYKDFLQAFYQHRKAVNPRYSYALFSLKAGIRSPNYLKLVMDGRRAITADTILPFSRALELNDLETIYWENLVAFNQAKTDEQKRYSLMKLTRTPLPERGAEGAVIREIRDEWDYFESWHHAAIRELVLLPVFEEDPKVIRKLLRGRVTEEEAAESLALLKRLGFLVHDEHGRLIQAERQIRFVNREDIANIVIQRFHHSTGRLALQSLEHDAVGDRDFSGLTIGVTHEALPRLKARITEFRKSLNEEFSPAENAGQVFQINFQVIPLTGSHEEKKQ